MEAELADQHFMLQALRLAGSVLPHTAPNPAVGCVLVRAGEVVGTGATQPPGSGHAETQALTAAGQLAAGATAYVTLEPCAHHGETPPCAAALIEAGVSKVVIACLDPDPRVNGKGAAKLEAAGIEVTCGLLESEAQALNRGFFSRTLRGRPWVTFKTALSIDGRTATRSGDSKWISGADSRAEVHRLRQITDAVLIGAGTARADNPRLTARSSGQADRAPWRIAVTSEGDIDAGLHLVSDEFAAKTILLTGVDRSDAPGGLSRSPVQWMTCETKPDGRVDLTDGLQRLGAFGINTILCEAGPTLAAGLWTDGLIDELICFRAPIVLGGDGQPAWNTLGVELLAQVSRLQRIGVDMSGEDVREHLLSMSGADLADAAAIRHLAGILSKPTL